MKTQILKILCLILTVCLLLPLTGCQNKAIYITCTNATAGTAIKDIAVSVNYGEDPMTHTATWYISKGDGLFSVSDDHILDGGDYELHIRYPLQSNKSVTVNTNCGEGTLVGTQKVDDETRNAVIRYHFAEEPAESVAPTEPHYVTVRCPDAKAGACIDDIAVDLQLDDMPLEFTASWKSVTEDAEPVDMAPGDTLQHNTQYQLHISYQMDLIQPAKVNGPYGVRGETILNKRLADGSFLIIVRFYFPQSK